MPLKSWILDKLNQMDGLLGRPDLPRRDAAPAHAPASNGAPATAAPQPVEHLGPYAPLIEAIRDELQRFVDGPLRLHLAIAERDRFLLTAIEIGCDDDEALQLLRGFIAEFKPDQIRRFLSRDVVSALPNANTFELAQFGGLRAVLPPEAETSDDTDEYAALLAELRQTAPTADPRAYRLTLVGRWVEREGGAPAAAGASATAARADEPALQTPLAGHRLEVDVEDAAGRRRVVLAAVVAGRRYSIGKGEGCDIVADGTYSSRRHAEFWFDEGSWWLLDTGSTNGIRVEVSGEVVARSPATPAATGTAAAVAESPIELASGARIVLSALAEGAPADYPTLALRLPEPAAAAAPAAVAAAPITPMTPIVPRPRTRHALMLTARMASGQRAAVIDAESMPFGVGRSRSQALAIDLAHASVSGQHLEITGCDGSGADVVVHGDNGVVVDGKAYPAGARLRWPVGSTMVLGHPVAGEPICTLLLTGRP